MCILLFVNDIIILIKYECLHTQRERDIKPDFKKLMNIKQVLIILQSTNEASIKNIIIIYKKINFLFYLHYNLIIFLIKNLWKSLISSI